MPDTKTTNTRTTLTVTNPTTLNASYSVLKSNVTTHSDNTCYYIKSNGLPSQNMVMGITNWQ